MMKHAETAMREPSGLETDSSSDFKQGCTSATICQVQRKNAHLSVPLCVCFMAKKTAWKSSAPLRTSPWLMQMKIAHVHLCDSSLDVYLMRKNCPESFAQKPPNPLENITGFNPKRETPNVDGGFSDKRVPLSPVHDGGVADPTYPQTF